MDAEAALGQCPLERAHGAKSLAVGGVNLRFGQRAPGRRIGIGLDLLRDVFIQAGIGQQPRLGQMRAVLGKSIDQVRLGQRAEMRSSCGSRRGLRGAQRRQPQPRHLRIKEMLVSANDGAVVGRGQRGIVVLRLIKAPAPVERGDGFRSPRIEPDLLVEDARRIGVKAQPVAQPAGAPVRRQRHSCRWESASARSP